MNTNATHQAKPPKFVHVETQPLEEFPEKVTFKVTRADLKFSYIVGDQCPIAQAARRYFSRFPNVDSVYVTARRVVLYLKSDERIYYYLNPNANDKAYARAQTLWGRIMGGFKVTLKTRNLYNV